MTDSELDVLRRVSQKKALKSTMHTEVLALIEQQYMHVNPVHVANEVCPYRLTQKGQRAISGGR